jgi:RNA polymerase sigma-70 factor (ECF subfamily)
LSPSTRSAVGHDTKTHVEQFESLLRPLYRNLYRAALFRTANVLDAEDLVQDACVRAFRFFATFRSGTNFRAWLFTILRNTHRNHLRSSHRRTEQIDFADVESVLAGREHAERAALDLDSTSCDVFGDEVHRALQKLPPDFRRSVLLAFVHEYRYREIAQVLRCPIGTVMSRLHRARKVLRKELRRGVPSTATGSSQSGMSQIRSSPKNAGRFNTLTGQ